MSEKYTPVKGDRVRVVLEGEVTYVGTSGGGWFEVDTEPGSADVFLSNAIAIEKIEPPVEVFGPGDVVRSKVNGRVFTLGVSGYLCHDPGEWFSGFSPSLFTSVSYERVELK